MKKLRITLLVVITFIIGFWSFNYFSNNQLSENVLAVEDYSKDSEYDIIFDANGGVLAGFPGRFEKIREGVYGSKPGRIAIDDVTSQPMNVYDSKADNKYIMYWSLDHLCSTRDLEVGADFKRGEHKVYYACYEETNFTDDGIRYVQGGAYVSGDTVECGDAVKVKSCYHTRYSSGRGIGYTEYCEFDAISKGNTGSLVGASGVVYRSKLNNDPVKTCTEKYKAYYYYDTTDINCGTLPGASIYGGNCVATSDSNDKVLTPDTSKSSNFIGWAAAADKESVNCNGTLVNSKSITLSSNVNYYACYKEDVKESCETTNKISNGKGEYKVNICYNATISGENLILTPTSSNINNVLTCADGYTLDNVSKTNVIKNTCTKEGSCYQTYNLKCVSNSRPTIKATSVDVEENGYGTIKFSGISNVGIKAWYASRYYEKPTDSSSWMNDDKGNYSLPSTPGSVFLWVKDKDGLISFATMASVIDRVNTDTTVSSLEVKTSAGTKLNTEVYAYSDYVDEGITSSDYVRLSNKVLDNSKILASGFNPFETAYKVTTTSSKIAVYATLTSNDASYVEGYEPRTVDLDYGINTILIKIKNKKGIERTYTIIVTREDDRNSSNLLKSLSVSEGKIHFDALKTDYVVSVRKNKTSVTIDAKLASSTASFVDGFGPRKVELIGDTTKVELKVKNQLGSVRAYNITFVKTGDEVSSQSEAVLSSLSLSKAYIAFDKNTYEYNTSVDYEIDSIDIYALAENGGDSVTLYKIVNGEMETLNNTNIKLNVGANTINILVANKDGKTRTYSVNVIRKENGLNISNETKLSMLDIDGYDIEFSPDKDYYEVKIKREKTLVIAATPANNRADIYISGNDNLTAFSTVRVKVVAENGEHSEYVIDIKKDKFNRNVEIIGVISGVIIIVCGIIIIRVKKRRKSINDYYAE